MWIVYIAFVLLGGDVCSWELVQKTCRLASDPWYNLFWLNIVFLFSLIAIDLPLLGCHYKLFVSVYKNQGYVIQRNLTKMNAILRPCNNFPLCSFQCISRDDRLSGPTLRIFYSIIDVNCHFYYYVNFFY